MAGHVFVDESKRRDYVLAAAAVPTDTLQTARNVIRALRLPGQTKIHMVKESSGRQRSLLAAIGSLDVRVTMYVATKTTFTAHVEARRRCLDSLIDDIAVDGHMSLCIERDDSQETRDRRLIRNRLGAIGYRDQLSYRHSKVDAEPLLVIPDAVAWAWPQGGDWRRRCEQIVGDVIRV